MSLPLVTITMGDPAGIGPEIVAKVAAQPQFHRDHRAFAIGDAERLAAAAQANNLPLRIEPLIELNDFRPQPGVLHVLSGPRLHPDLPYGRVDPRAGRAAFEYVQRAIALANSGQIRSRMPCRSWPGAPFATFRFAVTPSDTLPASKARSTRPWRTPAGSRHCREFTGWICSATASLETRES